MEKQKGKVFYGWYIVAAGCAVLAMTMGVINNSFAQYIKPVCEDMNFTRQQMSMNQTIMSAIPMLIGLLWGSISKRINLHKWMCAAAILTPAFYFAYSFAQNIYMFYAISLCLAFSYCLISMLVFTYIVGNWFIKNRGVAIGMASMGSGIGAMIMNTVISQMIIHWGWRHTYQVVALIIFVIIVPCIFFVIKEKPSEKGLMPYGYGEEIVSDGKEKKTVQVFEGYSYKEVLHMKVFWALVLCSVGLVLSICTLSQTVSPHLSDNGYSVTFAAAMASISMGALAVGKVILGRLFDRFGSRKAATFACTCTLIGIIGMIFCKNPISLVAIIIGVGLGCSFGAICMPIITQNIFGMKDYNAIYGKLTAATGLGAAVAPIISGRVYDVFGSYVPMFTVCAFITLAAIIILFMALPKKDNV